MADDGALLRIGLGGVCGTDVKYFHGRIDMPYPVILGHEIFGRVERLGRAAAAIHGVAEGDRVILKGSQGLRPLPGLPRRRPPVLPAAHPSTAAPPLRRNRRTCSAGWPTTSTSIPTPNCSRWATP